MRESISQNIFIFKLIICSLFYNSLCSWALISESIFEPFLRLCSRSFKYLGPIFIFLFIFLTTSVIITFYTCLLPLKWHESPAWACIHLVTGHWLLCNILFNYFRAAFTSPGYTSEDIGACRSLCKKCILPKPARSHHCAVCDRCVLKMDHHCPWLNNCVGHHNHRYFFLFTAYMLVACTYVSLVAYPLFKTHIKPHKSIGLFGLTFYQPQPSNESVQIHHHRDINYPQPNINYPQINYPRHLHPSNINHSTSKHSLTLHGFVAFEFLLCITASLALFGLVVWHSFLISRGETSIEVHINKKLKLSCHAQGMFFQNPHNHGLLKNWKLFLGLVNGKSFCRHILFPSCHPAVGDGIHWRVERVQRSFVV